MSPKLLALTVLFAALTGVEAAPEDRNAAFWSLLSVMIILMVLGMAATVDKMQAKAAPGAPAASQEGRWTLSVSEASAGKFKLNVASPGGGSGEGGSAAKPPVGHTDFSWNHISAILCARLQCNAISKFSSLAGPK